MKYKQLSAFLLIVSGCLLCLLFYRSSDIPYNGYPLSNKNVISILPTNERRAIATLITPNERYCQLALLMYYQARLFDPKKRIEFVLAYRNTFSLSVFTRHAHCKKLLDLTVNKDIVFYPIDTSIQRIVNQSWIDIAHSEWKYSMDRIGLWNMTRYHKVLYLDADVLLYRDISYLFHFNEDLVLALDQWNSCQRQQKMNGGVMLFKPSSLLYNTFVSLILDRDGETMKNCLTGKMIESDQELVNCMCGYGGAGYARTPEIQCRMLPWHLNVMPQHVQCVQYNRDDVTLIHYAGPNKPWNNWKDSNVCAKEAELGTIDQSIEWFEHRSRRHCYEAEVGLFTLWHCIQKHHFYNKTIDSPCRIVQLKPTIGYHTVLFDAANSVDWK
jgi:hypothetical protein